MFHELYSTHSCQLSSGEGKVGVKWRESKWHPYFWHTKLPAHWSCISFFFRSVFLNLWSSNAEHNHSLCFLHPISYNHTGIFSVKSSHTVAKRATLRQRSKIEMSDFMKPHVIQENRPTMESLPPVRLWLLQLWAHLQYVPFQKYPQRLLKLKPLGS